MWGNINIRAEKLVLTEKKQKPLAREALCEYKRDEGFFLKSTIVVVVVIVVVMEEKEGDNT